MAASASGYLLILRPLSLCVFRPSLLITNTFVFLLRLYTTAAITSAASIAPTMIAIRTVELPDTPAEEDELAEPAGDIDGDELTDTG